MHLEPGKKERTRNNNYYSSLNMVQLSSVDVIEKTRSSDDTILVVKLMKLKSRNNGWSDLPNDYKEKIKTAFWHLNN